MTQKEIELQWSRHKAEHQGRKNAEVRRYDAEKATLDSEEESIRQRYAAKKAELSSKAEALTLAKHALQRDGLTDYSVKSDEALTQLMEVHAELRKARDEYESLLRENTRRKSAARNAHEEIMRNLKIALTKQKTALWAQLEKSEKPTISE